MEEREIKKVIVLGASGTVGRPIVEALLAHPSNFQVSAVTRDKSKSSFADEVTVLESDYSPDSLRTIFTGQDAVVSTMAPTSVAQQDEIIDIAIECKVARFLPTEYGVDTSNAELTEKYLPIVRSKPEIVKYLKSREDKISWTAIINGSFFDWALRSPLVWNIAQRKALIFDGGEHEFEATTLAQVGRAVAAALSPGCQAATANQYVYVNSFTLTQHKVLAALKKATGETFEVRHEKVVNFHREAVEELENDPKSGAGMSKMFVANIYNIGGLNRYSKYPGGLWNDRLGLPEEDLQEEKDPEMTGQVDLVQALRRYADELRALESGQHAPGEEEPLLRNESWHTAHGSIQSSDGRPPTKDDMKLFQKCRSSVAFAILVLKTGVVDTAQHTGSGIVFVIEVWRHSSEVFVARVEAGSMRAGSLLAYSTAIVVGIGIQIAPPVAITLVKSLVFMFPFWAGTALLIYLASISEMPEFGIYCGLVALLIPFNIAAPNFMFRL
ncbi:hypothetical protein PRZ48_003484 [Zasmidium cellare]|uniref:NmrA-like domain-containing protein n=1 Tax=Zasmidium cellare TaxID=395010 RepID=A0ABR0EWQ8_ZASCE|nr:hypothetical protein PRZ48_003484 [Zasmidium cellare]